MARVFVPEGIDEAAQKKHADEIASTGTKVELHFHAEDHDCNLKCIRFIPTETTPIMQFILIKSDKE